MPCKHNSLQLERDQAVWYRVGNFSIDWRRKLLLLQTELKYVVVEEMDKRVVMESCDKQSGIQVNMSNDIR